MPKHRGRHQSSCKEGKRSLARLKEIQGVTAVILGRSIGGKSMRGKTVGYFKAQASGSKGITGVLLSSKGVQEVFVQIEDGCEAEVRQKIRDLFE